MAYVDDVRNSFDAAEFSATVSAGVGLGRTTAELALRDKSAVSLATTALQRFLALATQPGPPDVIAAYVQYSGGASEIFTALRAVFSNKAITAAAIDCLTAIVRYSLDPSNPVQALDGARSIVKDIVKARASLLYDVFVHDKGACAQKTLKLLRLVAQCHTMLAKELMNRINLASDHVAPALCSVTNNYCRVPFLDLLFVLLACGDRDILSALATDARPVLINSLKVVTERTLAEIRRQPAYLSEEGREKEVHEIGALPSHIQKRELIAAINLLLAIERHILTISSVKVRRSGVAYPMLNCLAEIAAAELPPLTVAPAAVIPEHEALRNSARRIFVAIASDGNVCHNSSIIAALQGIKVQYGGAALGFVVHVLECVPRICKQYLEEAPGLLNFPSLSSTWLATAAIISTCVLRLRGPVKRFAEKQFFERCLQSKDGLIMQTGVVILRAYCKVIAANDETRRAPEKFLPKLEVVEKLVLFHGTNKETLKLLSDYQRMLSPGSAVVEEGSMRHALRAARNDPLRAESFIRDAFRSNRYNAFEIFVDKGHLTRYIIAAKQSVDAKSSRRLWYLCRDAITSSELFPPGSEPEIDIILACLSIEDDKMEKAIPAFVRILLKAWRQPFWCFDDIQAAEAKSSPDDNVSVVSAAIVHSVRELKERQESSKLDGDKCQLKRLLSRIIRTVVAFQGLLGSGVGGSYLRCVLPKVLEPGEVWWESSNERSSLHGNVIAGNCRVIQELFSVPFRYPRTPFLQFIKSLSVFQLQALTDNSAPAPEGKAFKDSGALWSSWLKFRQVGEWTGELDLMGSLRCLRSVTKRDECSAMILGRFHESLHRKDSEIGMMKCAHRLKNEFSDEEYALSIAAILRVTHSHSVRRFLVSESIGILLFGLKPRANFEKLSVIIEDSLIHAVKCKHGWDVSQIEKMISFVLQMLSRDEGTASSCRQVSFCFSLLVRLLEHDDIGTRILAALFLSKAKDIILPDIRELSLMSVRHIATVLDNFPALRIFLGGELSRWTAEDIAKCIPNLLPLLGTMLNSEQTGYFFEKSLVDRDEAASLVLKALVVKKEALVTEEEQQLNSVRTVMGEIGRTILESEKNSAAVLCHLRSVHKSENDVAFPNLLLLFLESFAEWNSKVLHIQFSDAALTEVFTMIVRWFDRIGVDLRNPMHVSVLHVFMDLAKQLKTRRVALYGLISDTTSFEKGLISLCSALFSSLHSAMQCFPADSENNNGRSGSRVPIANFAVLLALQIVKEVLCLDLLLDKAAKRSLLSLSTNEGSMMKSCLGRRPGEARWIIKNRLTQHGAICELVLAALKMLPRFGIDSELAGSLSVIEGVLSSVTEFSASLHPRDIAIRDCMEGIAQHMDANEARKKYKMPEKRQGFFSPIKSQVLLMFEKKRLLATCTELLRKPPNDITEAELIEVRPLQKQHRDVIPYDPIFVLRTFLVASAEALEAPRSALMDIGRVAKDGLLSVAITGIACEEENVRALSYACLSLFSKFVGPISGVPIESAAALYMHRRQLSFLLALLQNSISRPMTKVAPLFAVWFRTCVREALSPSHETYNVVTYFLLRAPALDVADCVGIQYLLRRDEFQSASQREATRLLALEILRYGTLSLRDFNILRKRKLLDDLVTRAGEAGSTDSRILIELFKTFSALLSRDDGLLSSKLINRHELVPWLLPSRYSIDEPVGMVYWRLEMLQKLGLSVPLPPWSKEIMKHFSEALNVIVKNLVLVRTPIIKLNLMDSVIDCCSAIIRLNRHKRRCIDTDIGQIYRDTHVSQQSSYSHPELARAITRQNNNLVDVKQYISVLRSTFPKGVCRSYGVTNEDTLQRSAALEICMAHAFVADGLLFRQSWKVDNVIDSELFVVLAQAMYACPTVWLTMACFSALQTKGLLTDELAEYADRIPGKVPAAIYPEREVRFCSVVDTVRLVVIDKLISCAPHVKSALTRKGEEKERAMANLIEGLPQQFTEGIW